MRIKTLFLAPPDCVPRQGLPDDVAESGGSSSSPGAPSFDPLLME